MLQRLNVVILNLAFNAPYFVSAVEAVAWKHLQSPGFALMAAEVSVLVDFAATSLYMY